MFIMLYEYIVVVVVMNLFTDSFKHGIDRECHHNFHMLPKHTGCLVKSAILFPPENNGKRYPYQGKEHVTIHCFKASPKQI